MDFSETRILLFMQMVMLMKIKVGKIHNQNNFAYRADDSLSKEKAFKACPEMSCGFHYLSDKAWCVGSVLHSLLLTD